MRLKVFVVIGMVGALAPVGAQEAGVQVAQERVRMLAGQLEAQRMVITEKMAIEGLQQRMAVESRFTPGAPYAAEAVNEGIQVLADGNRISKKSVARMFRDSEGRTRREQVGANGQVESISISDPVAGVSYVLDPQNKTAFRNGVIMITPTGGVATATVAPGSAGTLVASRTDEGVVTVEARGDKEAVETRARVVAGARGGGGGRGGAPTTATFSGGGGRGGAFYPATMAASMGKTTTEELGQQVVEGVLATGTRSTTVIEAGTIGNERPIQIVSEQWTSTDLKLLVTTKHTDPRTGESSYRLTNITQAEQPRSLFEVPADYTLKESTIRRSPALEK
jgi:hypothetical protein